MSTINDVKSLYSIGGTTYDERRQSIVDSKVAAAELVANGADLKVVSDKLGLSPAFVQHYANQFKTQGASEFRKNVDQEEETNIKGFQGFIKNLLEEFKKAMNGG